MNIENKGLTEEEAISELVDVIREIEWSVLEFKEGLRKLCLANLKGSFGFDAVYFNSVDDYYFGRNLGIEETYEDEHRSVIDYASNALIDALCEALDRVKPDTEAKDKFLSEIVFENDEDEDDEDDYEDEDEDYGGLGSISDFNTGKMVMGMISEDNPLDSSHLNIEDFPMETINRYGKPCPHCQRTVFKRLPVCICGHVFEDTLQELLSKGNSKPTKGRHKLKYDKDIL